MKLSAEQKQAVAEWLSKGASIADVQHRLRDEFALSLTYMDTRFLIDDLGLNLAPPPPPKKKEDSSKVVPPPIPAPAANADDAIEPELIDEGDAYGEGMEEFGEAPLEDSPVGAGSVKVDVDRVMRPGTVVSGSVTFSDGNSGKWALDQFGRLVFEAKTQGYRPSQADLQAFQRELSSQLQRHGY